MRILYDSKILITIRKKCKFNDKKSPFAEADACSVNKQQSFPPGKIDFLQPLQFPARLFLSITNVISLYPSPYPLLLYNGLEIFLSIKRTRESDIHIIRRLPSLIQNCRARRKQAARATPSEKRDRTPDAITPLQFVASARS